MAEINNLGALRKKIISEIIKHRPGTVYGYIANQNQDDQKFCNSLILECYENTHIGEFRRFWGEDLVEDIILYKQMNHYE